MRGCWMIPVMNLLLGLPLFSQGGQPKPQFDVTSVKPAAPEGAGARLPPNPRRSRHQ
jgi:hypothetical protein